MPTQSQVDAISIMAAAINKSAKTDKVSKEKVLKFFDRGKDIDPVYLDKLFSHLMRHQQTGKMLEIIKDMKTENFNPNTVYRIMALINPNKKNHQQVYQLFCQKIMKSHPSVYQLYAE